MTARTLKEAVRALLPRTPRWHRILAGPLRGERLYTSWHDYPGALLGSTERPLLAWFERNVGPGETWLDVGAHYGYVALALCRRVGPGGRVFAFEPVERSAACIARLAGERGLAQLSLAAHGLSASPEIANLELPLQRGMADSTLDVGVILARERIRHIALDAIWPSLCGGNPRIDGIKIDVQGMEGEVLRGMRSTVAAWHPKLIVEFHAGVDRGPILHLLTSLGYGDAEAVDSGCKGGLFDDASYVFRSP